MVSILQHLIRSQELTKTTKSTRNKTTGHDHENTDMDMGISWGRTRSSWVNCALRDEEAVYWVSVAHYEAVSVGNWWYWVSRGRLCLYILRKVEIWTGVTDASLTHSLTDSQRKDRATQLLIKYKSRALVTQYQQDLSWYLHIPGSHQTRLNNISQWVRKWQKKQGNNQTWVLLH